MSRFVPLTEEAPALWLVMMLNVYKLPANKREARRQEIKQRLQNNEEDEELMAATMTPLGKLAAKQKFKTLIQDGFLPAMSDLITGDASECESAFGLVFYLLTTMEGKLKISSLKKLTAELSSEKYDVSTADIRIRYLSSLFSISSQHYAQCYNVLVALLNVTIKCKKNAALVGKLAGLDNWLNAWAADVSQEKRAALLRLVAQVHIAAAAPSSIARPFLLKYLRAVQGLGKEEMEAAAEYAADAIMQLVKETASTSEATSGTNDSDFDEIMGFDAVTALAQHKKHAPVYRLLQIFAGEQVSAFVEWTKKNKAVLKQYGLDEESLKSQMCTLTLCSLGAENSSLSYAQLRKELAVSSDLEVEAAVVDAVTGGRVTARIDQENELVSVLRVEPRQVQKVSWDDLAEKLQSWKGMVEKNLEPLGGY